MPENSKKGLRRFPELVYSRIMRLFQITGAVGVLCLAAFAQQTPEIVGGVSSTAPIEIDGTSMAPAPSWPIVDRDLIRTTSAPGLILTPDQNAVTLMPGTTVRVRSIQPHQTWIFVRHGGVNVRTKNYGVVICIANRAFQPSAATAGSLKIDGAGRVTRTVESGLIGELPVSTCGEELAGGMVALPPGTVAGGTASAAAASGAAAGGVSSTVAGAIAAATSAGVATSIGVASSASNSCASGGCNFNPTPVTPVVP
jgi:hypothetical protein